MQDHETTKVYKTARGWAMFIYLGGGALMLLSAWQLWLSIQGLTRVPWFIGSLAVGMIVFLGIGIWETYHSRLIWEAERLSYRSLLINRDLPFEHIKGYRVDEYYLRIESKDRSRKGIKVGTSLEDFAELRARLGRRFANLDHVDIALEDMRVLNNPDLGSNRAERADYASRAARSMKLLNLVSIAVLSWSFLYPHPYDLSVWTLVLLVPVALMGMIYFRGLVSLNERPNSGSPSALGALSISGIVLTAVMLRNYQVLDYSNAFLPTLLGAIMLMAITLKYAKIKPGWSVGKVVDVTFAAFCFLCYAFGLTLLLNCRYDSASPDVYRVEIAKMRKSSGKSRYYNAELNPWGPRTEAETVVLSRSQYERLEPGDTVRVLSFPGRLGVPWFLVEESGSPNH